MSYEFSLDCTERTSRRTRIC